MYRWFVFAASGLLLAACSQTGQPGVQASLAGSEAAGATTGGLFGTYPAPVRTAAAEADVQIASTFSPPAHAPLPVARPDFGDRVQIAAAPTQPAVVAYAPSTETAPTEAPAAIAGSLAAYERQEAGVDAKPVAPPQLATAGVTLGPRWYAAYENVETDCFPAELRKALDSIAAHYNSTVEVTSGMRNRGRRNSMHRSCRAADIRVAGVAPSALARFAKSVPGINGVGTYHWVGVTHIDTRAERFAWRY